MCDAVMVVNYRTTCVPCSNEHNLAEQNRRDTVAVQELGGQIVQHERSIETLTLQRNDAIVRIQNNAVRLSEMATTRHGRAAAHAQIRGLANRRARMELAGLDNIASERRRALEADDEVVSVEAPTRNLRQKTAPPADEYEVRCRICLADEEGDEVVSRCVNKKCTFETCLHCWAHWLTEAPTCPGCAAIQPDSDDEE